MSARKAAGSTEAAKGAEEDRGTWGNQCEFFLSCLGYAVGFGNVWRFPYLCYKNGGAAFLIPYTVMLLFSGLPIFFMELALGQYVSLGPALLFPKLAPIFSGLGWGMVVIPLLTALSFNVIIAWSFFYIFASFSDVLPWSRCDNDFNSVNCFTDAEAEACKNSSLVYFNRTCLSVGDYCGLAGLRKLNETHCHDPANGSAWVRPVETVLTRISASEDYFKNRMLGVTGRSWDDMGGLRWELVGCLALAWVIVGLCLAKGIKSSGKVVYFTALFPYVILAILFVRGITLDGAMKGIDFYFLQPDFSRLTEVEVWSDAAIQIFYSLGVSFGCLITLSSYNKFNNNCMRDAIIIAFSNCSTSVFAGFVIFSILGFLAQELGVEVKDVASSGSGLAFIVYPAAVSLLPLPQLWSVLFFVMLINIGLASQLTMVETVTTTLFDYMPSLRSRKPLVVACVCFVIFLMGLSMCLEGGILMFELFFWYSAGISVIILAITQILAVIWVYGFRRFLSNIKEMGVYIPAPLKAYWLVTWIFITPVLLVLICFFYIYFFVPAYWGDYVFPPSIQVLGWLLSASSMGLIPLGALAALCKTKSFRGLFQTSPDLCPAHVRSQRAAQQGSPAPRFEYNNAAFEGSRAKLAIYQTLAAWVTLHGRELLVLATAAGVLVYEWDGSVLLHAHLLPTPPADASSSFTRGIAALYSGVICVGVHTGEILSLPVTEEGTVGEGEKVRYHARPVTALAAHGLILVSADDQGTIVVAEDVEGLRKMCLIETYNETAVTCLKAWAGQIVAGYLSGHIRIFNLHDGRIQAEVCAHVRSVSGLDVAVESGLLISASEDTYVRVWQLGKIDVPIEHKYSFSERDTTICGVTFTDDLGAGYLTTGYDRLDLLCYAM